MAVEAEGLRVFQRVNIKIGELLYGVKTNTIFPCIILNHTLTKVY